MQGNMWWKNARIYELYVDKFAGNFANLTAQLGYIEKLGVNTLHILPHYPSPMQDGGYDVMDYLNVRPELGTLEDFDAFIAAAHARGIKVIVDMVLNHVSEHHPWFIEARSDKNSQKRDYFLWSETREEFASAWNAFPGIKPSNWIRNDPTRDYYYATFYPQQPDLNWDNPHVVESMLANMDFWADRGVDGFRLDAALTLVKRNGTVSRGLPETHVILKLIRKHMDEKYRGRIALLGEAFPLAIGEMKKFFGDGDECHLLYHFALTEAMYLALIFDEPGRVDELLEESAGIPENCAWACFLRNHDEITLASLPLIRRTTLVSLLDPKGEYLFNHGQATAMRLANIFDTQKLLDAFRLLYSVPGAVVMYYGDEIGMKNLPREEGVIDTRVFVRGHFDWQEAEKQMQNPHSLFTKTAEIIRKSYSPWRIGRAQPEH